jgi:uncharacterized protein (UPF0333 family)
MFKKLNMKGVSHHFLLPVLAVLVIAGIGGYVMQRSSSAATTTEACNKITFGRYRNNPVYTKYKKYKPCVQAIQRKVGANADGIYGNYTQSRVKIWQKNHNMSNADGVVGSATWAKMGLKTTYTNTPTTAQKTAAATAADKKDCQSQSGTWNSSTNKCKYASTKKSASAYSTKSSCETAGYYWGDYNGTSCNSYPASHYTTKTTCHNAHNEWDTKFESSGKNYDYCH